MMERSDDTETMQRRHSRLGILLGFVAVGMLGMAFAAVPIYRLICQVTGFGGTTQRVEQLSDKVVDRAISIRFDANTASGLQWQFAPEATSMEVKLGENAIAFYRATSTAAAPSAGVATFNVTPEIAGAYFNKVHCFCFDQQTLKAGESVEMPVSFYVDPALLDQVGGGDIKEITLSYTFYPAEVPAAPGGS